MRKTSAASETEMILRTGILVTRDQGGGNAGDEEFKPRSMQSCRRWSQDGDDAGGDGSGERKTGWMSSEGRLWALSDWTTGHH
jgi:hypothetical protein